MGERRLSDEWVDLAQKGEVPAQGKVTTAERIERDRERKRKRMPTEDKRQGRKIGPTLSAELVRRLRQICKSEGYINGGGKVVIVSSVIEVLLWAAVEAYERGEFEEIEVARAEKRVQRKARK